MKTTSIIILTLAILLIFNHANAESIKKAYLDQNSNVHVITSDGTHRKITHKGNSSMLKLAPDKESVTWLVLNTWKADDDDKPGSEELAIYRNKKTISIKCTPFIRDYWFWKNGSQIAVDCGGRRFAGREILYDINTLRELADFDQADVSLEKRPDWSKNDD